MKKYLIYFFISTALYAYDVEEVKHEIFLQLTEEVPPSSHPFLLLIGGYPGAGKTSLIQALQKEHNIAAISWDSIRQALQDKNLKEIPETWEIIESVTRRLLKNLIEQNVNIAIDANAYANNIKRFEEFIKLENAQDTYRIVKICLNTPLDVLLERVKSRQQMEGVHQGTESDLLQALNSNFKKTDLNDYSLVIKNDADIPFEMELAIVNTFLSNLME